MTHDYDMDNQPRRRAGFALQGLALSLGLAASVFAGEAPPVPPAVPDPVAAAAEKKDDKFVYDSRGRRDPFSFSLKPNIKDDPVPGSLDKTDPTQKPDIDPKLILQKQQEAEGFYAKAEAAFLEVGLDGHPVEVLTICDSGMKVFADTPNAGAIPEWQSVRGRLDMLRKAAERMKQRQDSRKKFEETNIRLTGIVARDRGSRAIVNGERVGKGDIVSAGDSYVVSIDDIQPDQVILVTPDGFKVKLTWSEIAK